MSTTGYAVRVGINRGWIEFKASMRSPQDLTYFLMMPIIFIVVLLFQRDNRVDGTTLSLASLSLPGVIGMLLGYGAMVGAAYQLTTEREDGTLLRAKAVPNGMVGYVSGGITNMALATVFSMALLIIPGLILFDGLMTGGIGGWLTLLWVTALALLATVPFGAVIGSLMTSPRAVGGWGMMITGGLTAISGIFYPISALASWLQTIAQIFPIYWLGLGMRSAFLPEEAAAVEITGTWRHLETIGVLGAWGIIGLLLAPVVLRRMAQRESGSTVEQRRQKALQRV